MYPSLYEGFGFPVLNALAGRRTLPFRRDDLDERFSWDALARNVLRWCA